MIALLVKRYGELVDQAKKLEASKFVQNSEFSGSREQVDYDTLLNWKVKAKSHLINTCGAESIQVREFTDAETGSFSTSLSNLRRMLAVFSAAKEDYEGGYLTSTKSLVQAEMFGSELDQARELLAVGYLRAAAVIAGAVLETALRDLCARRNIAPTSLARMNDDLVKAGAYNDLRRKRIVAISAMRNEAAHGLPLTFDDHATEAMLADIERFLEEFL